jgi:malate synthase
MAKLVRNVVTNTASTMPASRKLQLLIVLMTRMHATLPMFAAMAKVVSTKIQAPTAAGSWSPGPTLSPPLHQCRRVHARHVLLQRRGQAPLVRSLAASCACARTASTSRPADKANTIEGGIKQQHVRSNFGAVE